MAIGRINATLTGVQPGGLAKIVPTSVAVGAGSASVDSNGNVSFSSASTVQLNSVFSSTYQNYKVIYSLTNTGSFGLFTRFGTSGTPDTASNGNYFFVYGTAGAGTVAGGNAGSTNKIYVGESNSAANQRTASSIDIYGPNGANWTQETFISWGGDYQTTGGGVWKSTSQYTDLVLFSDSTGLITGNIRIYGYN